jgi:N-acetylglucosamine-6-sulfatase
MPRPRRLRGWAGLVATLLLGAVLVVPGQSPVAASSGSQPKAVPATTSPNIVFIITDDQRYDTLWAMPNVQSQLIAHGINFSNAFATTSLCCPSRVGILTGTYSHTTQVYDNAGTYGGFGAFDDDDNTVATWLHDAGYRTALLGKYLNGYNVEYIPPGWDHWNAFIHAPHGGAYYNYDLYDDGVTIHHDFAPEDYSTDVLAADADDFIRSTPDTQPLFLYLSFKAPHVPSTPAPRHLNEFNDLLPYRPPNYNEADVSDKPAWVQGLPVWPSQKQNSVDNNRKNQYRTFLSVDDAVNTVLTALTDEGRLSNTMIVYASDNGWSLGEHRWNNKKAIWEESIRVPLVIRYDPLTPTPRTDTHLVANIDWGPTFADLAGVIPVGAEGSSLMSIIQNPSAPWRKNILIEHLQGARDEIPTFCGVRRAGFAYVLNNTGEEELYDLTADPYELVNVASDPGYATTLVSMRKSMKVLCQPVPPGFDPPGFGFGG